MIIEITVYKDNGKFYASEVVEVDQTMLTHEDFKQFIRDNSPANIGQGFITTRSMVYDFHNALWKYDEIYTNT